MTTTVPEPVGTLAEALAHAGRLLQTDSSLASRRRC
jgi:hypothetical protein